MTDLPTHPPSSFASRPARACRKLLDLIVIILSALLIRSSNTIKRWCQNNWNRKTNPIRLIIASARRLGLKIINHRNDCAYIKVNYEKRLSGFAFEKKGKPLAVYPVLNERASSTNEWTFFFFFFFSFRVLMVRFFLPLRLLLLLLPSLPHFCHIFFKTWLDDVKTNLYPEIPAEKRLRRGWEEEEEKGEGEKNTQFHISPQRGRAIRLNGNWIFSFQGVWDLFLPLFFIASSSLRGSREVVTTRAAASTRHTQPSRGQTRVVAAEVGTAGEEEEEEEDGHIG